MGVKAETPDNVGDAQHLAQTRADLRFPGGTCIKAVEAIRLIVCKYLTKPFSWNEIGVWT
jgi:ActR/RegA family two-component response regulator